MEKTNFRTFLGFLFLLSRICVSNASGVDVSCLKSIKDSLHDPFNNLDSWDFSNATEGFICRFVGIGCWHADENKVLNIMLPDMGLVVFQHKIVSLNIWKLRKKEHLTSGSEDELSSQHKILKLEKFVTRMSFTELKTATSEFSEDHLVGNGMLGKVYKAILPNGWTLAIKKLNDWENLENEFVSEITTLGGLRHRNLLPLIGFCAEKQERLLVYKYMPNGSLDEWLHSNEDKAKILDFPLRAKIALGIAKGLAWLHHGYELHVTHGSISTRCILLDQNFEPKISNFWEAKFWSKNDSALSWSLFPVAEYSGLGSYKQDIYCFGVVLLEDLLGKGADDLILQFLELACNCVKFFPNERPTMLEVYDMLKNISQGRRDWIQKIPLSTDNSSKYD